MSLLINETPICHDRNSMIYPIIAASRELLRRQLIHKQHQITCPVRFAAAVASVAE
jgi:hypothetical protein